MTDQDFDEAPAFSKTQLPALRYLVESALQRVRTTRECGAAETRADRVARLCDALVSDSETSHRAVIASLLASGIGTDEIYDVYIPAASRLLGERWVRDEASFVDVTVGAGRLQALFRSQNRAPLAARDRTVPLGQSVLMVIPDFEDHSLGAFLAAEQFRRHGLWVRLAIGMTREELCDAIAPGNFALIGVTAGTPATLDRVGGLIDGLRTAIDNLPPIVLGGRAICDPAIAARRTGADLAVLTVREAVERTRLASVAPSLTLERQN